MSAPTFDKAHDLARMILEHAEGIRDGLVDAASIREDPTQLNAMLLDSLGESGMLVRFAVDMIDAIADCERTIASNNSKPAA